MEDTAFCIANLVAGHHFFGVYDGHNGSAVAKYCQEFLHLQLIEEINDGINDDDNKWREAFTNCYLKVDAENKGLNDVGSTAVTALICLLRIVVANCSDSRVVLCRGKEPVALSIDHKPTREDELVRIKAAGGTVLEWHDPHVYGVLAMSRYIGDRCYRPAVIAESEAMVVPRMDEDEFLILASDDLWDVMSNKEACDLTRRVILKWYKNYPKGASTAAVQSAANVLTKMAIKRRSEDNITIIVIDLKSRDNITH